MNRALIVIDYTYDFIADDGKLTCGEPGQDLDNRIAKLVEQFNNEEQYIVIAEDFHFENDPYHPESKLFPPHNIVGTTGRNTYGKTGIATGKAQNIHFMDKTRYSAFAGTDLDIRLRERGIKEVHLVGVCTDICILHTAVDAYNLGYKIVVHEDGVASFNPVGHKWALSHFKETLGAKVVKAGVEVGA